MIFWQLCHAQSALLKKSIKCLIWKKKFLPGAEIGVLKSLPFDQINVNMFLIEMYHFVGEKEKEIKAIFARNGYKEGPEIFPNLADRNDPLNPNYDLIFYKVSYSPTFYEQLFAQKYFAHLLCTYSFGLSYFGERKLVQKLLVKWWWNWLQEGLDIELNLNCSEFTGGYQGRGYRWGQQECIGPLVLT